MNSTRELLIEQMKDLYDAEKQLVAALPKLAKASSNEELTEAFESHLKETRGHVERLEKAFELLGEKAKGKPCKAMKGLIEEGGETTKEDFPEVLLDSAIICAAQKVEHYEIAGYGTVIAWALAIGEEDVAGLFEKTLEEEKAADEKLTGIAGTLIAEAAEGVEEQDEAEGEPVEASPRKKGATGRLNTATATKRRAG